MSAHLNYTPTRRPGHRPIGQGDFEEQERDRTRETAKEITNLLNHHDADQVEAFRSRANSQDDSYLSTSRSSLSQSPSDQSVKADELYQGYNLRPQSFASNSVPEAVPVDLRAFSSISNINAEPLSWQGQGRPKEAWTQQDGLESFSQPGTLVSNSQAGAPTNTQASTPISISNNDLNNDVQVLNYRIVDRDS